MSQKRKRDEESSSNEECKKRKCSQILPVNDPSRPICRSFIRDKCTKKNMCLFFHPIEITPTVRKKVTREIGRCYCGAHQITMMNRTRRRTDEDDEAPLFFVVCGKTRRSMKRCM